jgi:hypothetical protein
VHGKFNDYRLAYGKEQQRMLYFETSDQQVNLKTNERSLQNETKLKISYF